ncbi:MAG: tetratricopeptide repeat protein [Bacteroidales bacterium]|nr:tetratricopeptide repeat protein [Bacteroidales bacterium]
MRLFIPFVILFMCLINTSSGQQTKVDSLRNIIEINAGKKISSHAQILLAKELLPSNPEEAFELLTLTASVENENDDVVRADYFNAWGTFYWYANDHTRAIDFFMMTMNIGKSPAILPKIAQAANNMGCLYSKQGNADSARKYLEQALEIDIKLENETGIMKSKFDLGVFNLRQDNYATALLLLHEVADFQEENKDSIRLTYTLNALGNTYFRLNRNDKAIEQYHKAINIGEVLGMLENQITAYNNLTAIYSELPDSFNQALQHGYLGMKLASENNDNTNLLSISSNIGSAYLSANQADSALYYYEKALALVDQINEPSIQAQLHINAGRAYFVNALYEKARLHIHKGLEIAKSINSLSNQSRGYKLLASVDSIQGNFRNALINFQHSTRLYDSIWSLENASRIADLEIAYETRKNEFEITHLKKEFRLVKMMNLTGVFIILLLLAVSAAVIAYMRSRNTIYEQKLLIQQKENERVQSLLQANKRELSGKVTALIKLEETIGPIKDEINKLITRSNDDTSVHLQSALQMLTLAEKGHQLWKDFEIRFNELNDEFITKLASLYPTLSPAEIKLCALLKMQLSTKEIAELSNRSQRTIEYTRTNIRKKIGLDACDNLTKHLLNI